MLSPSNSCPIILYFHQLYSFSTQNTFQWTNHTFGFRDKKAPVYYYFLKKANNTYIIVQASLYTGISFENTYVYNFSPTIIHFKSNFIMYLLQSPKPREPTYSNKPQGVGMLQASSSLEASAWGLWRPTQKVFQGELKRSDKWVLGRRGSWRAPAGSPLG